MAAVEVAQVIAAIRQTEAAVRAQALREPARRRSGN